LQVGIAGDDDFPAGSRKAGRESRRLPEVSAEADDARSWIARSRAKLSSRLPSSTTIISYEHPTSANAAVNSA
jgi:hypothetical protein